MEAGNILIVDDDKNICKIIRDYLEFEDFNVSVAYDGEEALTKIKQEDFDLIILDIMLPEVDGLEVCQELRPQNNTPILMLSAKNKEIDRITGLELGADDYVTKPFSPKEIAARVKAILRRTKQDKEVEEKDVIKFPELMINKNYRTVKVSDKEVKLTPKEFDLLCALASAPRQVFAREDLLKKVWGYDYFGDIRTVDTHIKSLRKKLSGKVKDYIKTVWGVGYKFEVKSD